MTPKVFCQSCTMPIDDLDLRGTEKDGKKSSEYCSYCYANGEFINPNTTLDEMRVILKSEMEKRHIPNEVVQVSMNMLPFMKRWKNAVKTKA